MSVSPKLVTATTGPQTQKDNASEVGTPRSAVARMGTPRALPPWESTITRTVPRTSMRSPGTLYPQTWRPAA